MGSVIGPVILGIVVSIIGFSNIKGNISSVHWYHRRRITEENRLPYGRMIGLGTVICGVSIAIFGCFSFLTEKTTNELFIIIGSVLLIIGIVIGLALNLHAMVKYNNGIF